MADGTLKVGTITTSSGSGNIAIGSGVTLLSNVPAFRAYTDTIQTTSDGVATKAELDLETYDTDNCYDTSTYRFTPNVAGYYQINLTVRFKGTSTQGYISAIFKNGLETYRIEHDQNTTVGPLRGAAGSALVYFNGTTDYVEAYGWIQATSPLIAQGQALTRFTGHLVSV